MSRKLATLQLVSDVQPIENADAIEKVRVNDWWCVAKKGEFSKGDPCIYIEIDSLLPADNPAFDFLAKGGSLKSTVIDGKTYTGYRLKTGRFRGQISQGLALPLSVMSDDWTYIPEMLDTDYAETLGIVKYEVPIPACLSGQIAGIFPALTPKTDQERIQNILEDVKAQEVRVFHVTEKLDGTSATYIKMPGEVDKLEEVFRACSRNWELTETEDNTHWKVARAFDIEKKLPVGYSIQGELVGPGIQKNPLKLSEVKFYAFDVYDLYADMYLSPIEFKRFCLEHGFESVPTVSIRYEIFDNTSIDELLEYSNMKSLISPDCDIEGLVFKSLQEARIVARGGTMRLSFKVISNNYLLKHE